MGGGSLPSGAPRFLPPPRQPYSPPAILRRWGWGTGGPYPGQDGAWCGPASVGALRRRKPAQPSPTSLPGGGGAGRGRVSNCLPLHGGKTICGGTGGPGRGLPRWPWEEAARGRRGDPRPTLPALPPHLPQCLGGSSHRSAFTPELHPLHLRRCFLPEAHQAPPPPPNLNGTLFGEVFGAPLPLDRELRGGRPDVSG